MQRAATPRATTPRRRKGSTASDNSASSSAAIEWGSDGRPRYRKQHTASDRPRRDRAGQRGGEEASCPADTAVQGVSPVPAASKCFGAGGSGDDGAATAVPERMTSEAAQALFAIRAASGSPRRPRASGFPPQSAAARKLSSASPARGGTSGGAVPPRIRGVGPGGRLIALEPEPPRSIQALPFGNIDAVVETTSSPLRTRAREVFVSTGVGRSQPTQSRSGLVSQTTTLDNPAAEVRALGPSHLDFDTVAARSGPTAWTKLENDATDQRKAARFRQGVLTPKLSSEDGAIDSAAAVPTGRAIRRGWEVDEVLGTAGSPSKVDRAAVTNMFTVKGEYRHYLLRDMLDANGIDATTLLRDGEDAEPAKSTSRRSSNAGSPTGGRSGGTSAARKRLKGRLNNMVVSSDATLEAASESENFSPTRLYKARLKEQKEIQAAQVAIDSIAAAEDDEARERERRAEAASVYTSTAISAIPDEVEIERMRRVHELIMLARTRTERFKGDVQATPMRNRDGSPVSQSRNHGGGQPPYTGHASGSPAGDDEQLGFERFVQHEQEFERLSDSYFAAREHHTATIAEAAHGNDRMLHRGAAPDFSRQAFDAARRRVQTSGPAGPRISPREPLRFGSSTAPSRLQLST